MILVTVGTTPFPFQRMADLVRQIIGNREGNKLVVFQYGVTDVSRIEGKNIRLYSEMSFNVLRKYIKTAEVVVSHGGPATIFQVWEAGKKPYVLPRKKQFKEHVNNHQAEFAAYIVQAGKALAVEEMGLDVLVYRSADSKNKTGSASSVAGVVAFLDRYVRNA